ELGPEIALVQRVSVDVPIPKVPDQQVTSQPSEACRRDCQAPGGIELSMGDKASEQIAMKVKGVDEAMAAPRHVVVPVRILLGERHVQHAVQGLDIEGRIACGDFGVSE